MGRFKAKRQRQQSGRFNIDGHVVNEAAMHSEFAAIAGTVDDHGRVVFWNDPALQLGEIASGVDPVTGQVTVERGASGQLPVALFEPARALMTRMPGQPPREQQADQAIALGLSRFGRGFAQLGPADGWQLHRLVDDRLELRTPDGGVYSRIAVPFDPAWISAVVSTGFALCLYGIQLGVRTPPGVPDDEYTDRARLDEFRRGRALGFTAAGLVPYVNNRG
ncbi:hypothetical protein [Streptomyces sp. MT206]|uniref:hypothetical protein n=1 Tax=Streptomyces sp. MT206 TaxID=3031407 RepID=UPI002FCA1713